MSVAQKKSSDEAIVSSMLRRNYHVAIVLIEQLEYEQLSLSHENQIRLVECLVEVGRFLDALNKIREFRDSGNSLRRLTFLKGYALFMLGEYYNAAEIFGRDPDWERWARKCRLMGDIASGKESQIVLGEIVNITSPEKIRCMVEQDQRLVIISIMVGNVLSDNVDVLALQYSLDIKIKGDTGEFSCSYELADRIIPRSLVITTDKEKVQIKVEKEKEGIWNEIVKSTNELLGESDVTLDTIMNLLQDIPDYKDKEASEMFEQAQISLTEDIQKQTKFV